jgi:hypothetical protein
MFGIMTRPLSWSIVLKVRRDYLLLIKKICTRTVENKTYVNIWFIILRKVFCIAVEIFLVLEIVRMNINHI